jgi:hypothetical protein
MILLLGSKEFSHSLAIAVDNICVKRFFVFFFKKLM